MPTEREKDLMLGWVQSILMSYTPRTRDWIQDVTWYADSLEVAIPDADAYSEVVLRITYSDLRKLI